jgi:hypothetical protein
MQPRFQILDDGEYYYTLTPDGQHWMRFIRKEENARDLANYHADPDTMLPCYDCEEPFTRHELIRRNGNLYCQDCIGEPDERKHFQAILDDLNARSADPDAERCEHCELTDVCDTCQEADYHRMLRELGMPF